MGGFRDLAAGLGQAAALTVESDAFALITANAGLGVAYGDGQNVFAAPHNNIGPTGAMSASTLDGARAAMAKQVSTTGGPYLDLRPAVWLGPAELAGQARALNDAQYEPATSLNQPNRVRGLFADVVDSAFLSAQSATRHYLLADPAVYPTFAVGFVDGNEEPTIKSAEIFGYDGLQMRVTLDYGVAVLDFRTGVTCAGA